MPPVDARLRRLGTLMALLAAAIVLRLVWVQVLHVSGTTTRPESSTTASTP